MLKNLMLIIPLSVALLCSSCSTVKNLSDSQIVAGVTLSAQAGFHAISGSKRHQVAIYVKQIAGDVRVIAVQSPSPEALSGVLQQAVDKVPEEYRALATFVAPLVVAEYKTYYDRFASDHQKLIQVLNDIATGLEAAAAQN